MKPKRFSLDDIVFVDKYKQKSIEDIEDMIRRRNGKEDIEDYISMLAKRKFMADFKKRDE